MISLRDFTKVRSRLNIAALIIYAIFLIFILSYCNVDSFKYFTQNKHIEPSNHAVIYFPIYEALSKSGSNGYSRIKVYRYVHSKPTADFNPKNDNWMSGINDLMNLPNDIMNLFVINKVDTELNNNKKENSKKDYFTADLSADIYKNSSSVILSTPSYNEIYIGKNSEYTSDRIIALPNNSFINSSSDSTPFNTIVLKSVHIKDNNYKNNINNSIAYYVSSDLDSIHRINKSEKINEIRRYPAVFNYVGNVINNINIFKKDKKEQAVQALQKSTSISQPGVYQPKGLFGTAARLVRRRILNILDRSPTNWANALSRDDDLYNVNTAIYVSKPFMRNNNYTAIQNRFDSIYEPPSNGLVNNVGNTLKRVKSTVMKVLPFKRDSEFDLQDAKLSLFDKMYRRERRDSIVTTKPKLERFTRLNILMSSIANKTSSVLSFLQNEEDEPNNVDILGIKMIGPLFENNIITDLDENKPEKESNNSFFSPVFKVFDQVGNMFGSINKFKNEKETKNKDLAFNMIATQQEKVNLLYSDGKELTSRTLQNLVQAGKETVDETRIKVTESINNKLKEISNDKKEVKDDNKFKFRFPWDVHYRAEIPFFENSFNKTTEVSIEVSSKESFESKHYPNSTTDYSDQIIQNTNNYQTTNKRTPIIFTIANKVFPISSLVVSKIFSIIPFKATEVDLINNIQNEAKDIESAWLTSSSNLDYMNYSPITNQIPFPLITDPEIQPPYQYANEVTSIRNIQPLLLTTDTADIKMSTKSQSVIKTTIESDPESLPLQEIDSPSTFISTTTAKLFSSIASIMNEAAANILNQNSKVQQRTEEVEKIEEFPQSASAINQIDLDKPIKVGRATELRTRPTFLDRNQIPLPSKADFTFIFSKKTTLALAAALDVKNERDADEFMKVIGLDPLISALTKNVSYSQGINRVDVVKAMCRLTREKKSLADEIVKIPSVIHVLCDFMELPLRRFHMFQSLADKEKDIIAQKESAALVQRLVRSSDKAVSILRHDMRLKKVLSQIVEQGAFASSIANKDSVKEDHNNAKNEGKSQVKKKNSTTIIEYTNLEATQMARVAQWGLGGVQWKPKQPGQKGLRILSLDGGGTRGVLSIAYLKEIMNSVGGGKQPHEVFDIICGTSTGGIIAVLLGAQQKPLDLAEALYDDFIDKVFGQKSNLKLVTEQAFYDETALESVLYKMCGDQLLLDSNQNECPRVFCISTKVNNNPPQTQIWRNYNYPSGQVSRYPGTFRVNTITAVRATTAAPTFFTPVQWEEGLYCDGALVANNPTAIALQEAKILYPGVPVELVVSIGTGYINMGGSYMRSMGWDLLVNNLVASSTDTEDVHALLVDFLPKDKYFRFNPLLKNNLAIDEKNKSILTDLKKLAKENFRTIIKGPDSKYYEQLFKTLRGPVK